MTESLSSVTYSQLAASAPCPCGLQDAKGRVLVFERCCGPLLAGVYPAPDAVALMRSRYTAFVVGNATYLRATWLPRTCPSDLAVEADLKWLGLRVVASTPAADGRAQVEFVARFRRAGKGERLHESSRFVHVDGRWWYEDGELDPVPG